MVRHRVWWLGLWATREYLYWWLTSQLLDLHATGARPIGPPALPDGRELVASRVGRDRLSLPLELLGRALPNSPDGRAAELSAAQALSGVLITRHSEWRLTSKLGALLIPPPLRDALLAGDPDSPEHTVVVAGGPDLAQVPWELLALSPEVRLIERARVRAAFSPTLTTGHPSPPREGGAGNVLAVIDASPPDLYLYDHPAVGIHNARWVQMGREPGRLHLGPDYSDRGCATELSAALTAGPRRLLVFGHLVAGRAEAPQEARFLLEEGHVTARQILREPHTWPMPERVALIGCHSNDAQHAEQLGLAVAAVYAGADLVTTTRWSLPMDRVLGLNGVTTALGIAVDNAHDSEDPVGAIRAWQIKRLAEWRTEDCPETSPLLWASLVTYYAPPPARPLATTG